MVDIENPLEDPDPWQIRDIVQSGEDICQHLLDMGWTLSTTSTTNTTTIHYFL